MYSTDNNGKTKYIIIAAVAALVLVISGIAVSKNVLHREKVTTAATREISDVSEEESSLSDYVTITEQNIISAPDESDFSTESDTVPDTGTTVSEVNETTEQTSGPTSEAETKAQTAENTVSSSVTVPSKAGSTSTAVSSAATTTVPSSATKAPETAISSTSPKTSVPAKTVSSTSATTQPSSATKASETAVSSTTTTTRRTTTSNTVPSSATTITSTQAVRLQVPSGILDNRFYYPRLTRPQQEIYEIICASVSAGEKSFTFNWDNGDYGPVLKKALTAFIYDFPEYPALRGGYHSSSSNGAVTVTITKWGFCENMGVDAYKNDTEKTAKKVAAEASRFSDDFDRIKYVHNYLCNNVAYDYASYRSSSLSTASEQQSNTAYGAFRNGKAVCGGYSKAFVLIMHELGYECGYVSGTGHGDSHAWNILKADGKYYYMDVTWDDQNDNGDKNYIKYQYFCVTSSEMGRDHTLTEEICSLPQATSDSLNYYVRNGYVLDSYDFDKAAEILKSQADKPYCELKFTNRIAYNEAYKDLSRLCSVIREMNGVSKVTYYHDDEQYVLEFKCAS